MVGKRARRFYGWTRSREGERKMLIEALKAEVDDYVERNLGARDKQEHALVVRNERAQARRLTLGAGTLELSAPLQTARYGRQRW